MPNGDHIVSASRDKTIKMWEVATGWVRGKAFIISQYHRSHTDLHWCNFYSPPIFQFLYFQSSSIWSEPYPIGIYFVPTSAETCTFNLHFSRLQVLCEDIHRPQGVGEDGASQPGRLVDCQLLQRPDGACLGGRLEGVQSRVAGAWTCGRVHLLGPWQRSPHHLGGHRLRGVYSCCRMWHLPTEGVCVCLVQLQGFPK